MKRRQAQGSGSFPPIFRAISLASAIVVIVAGVTFAVMRSQEAKVTGNSVQAATANLLVGLNNTDFAAIQNGFAFNGLVPGQPAVPLNGHTIFLKNAGGTSLALGVAVSSAPLNPDNVNFNKVHVIFTPAATGIAQDISLQSLTDNPLGQILLPAQLIAPNSISQYKIQISMDADAISGTNASLSNLNLSFSGLVFNN